MLRIYNAFFYSMAGLKWAITRETAVKQEVLLLVMSIPAAFLVATQWWQMVLLVGSLVVVVMVELLNTAIEKLCDHVRPEIHADIKVIKDLGSAACFLSQCLAGATWLTVLGLRLL